MLSTPDVIQGIANVSAGMKHLLMMFWVPERFSQRFAVFSALALLQHVCHILPIDEAYTHVYFHGLDITQLGLAHKLASEIGRGLGINFWATILSKPLLETSLSDCLSPLLADTMSQSCCVACNSSNGSGAIAAWHGMKDLCAGNVSDPTCGINVQCMLN